MTSSLFRRVAELLEAGEAPVLVTVVATEGPAPGEPGARMLVFPDGRVEGTVGGGALEFRAVQEAQDLLRSGKRTLLATYELGEIGMLCGGKSTLFYEVLMPQPTLAIFGAGHVGWLLACLASDATPWPVLLFDYRAEALRDLPPGVKGKLLGGYQEIPDLPQPSYVAICTDSHESDYQLAEGLLRAESGPVYLCMLGSRAKAQEVRQRLQGSGVARERLQALRCPAGLPIGGKDPGSVAVSILAEILAFHHGKLGSPG